MRILTIDIGTYSIKYVAYDLERKSLFPEVLKEIPLPTQHHTDEEDQESSPIPLETWSTLIKDLQEEENDSDAKVITIYPSQLVTSRYLTLPSTNRKKIQMMIPFQLDDSIPFSITDAHLISSNIKKGTNTESIVSVCNKDEFSQFYQEFHNQNVLPSLLTSELELMQAYASGLEIHGPTLFIDSGHTTTKAYILYQGQVVSNHISYRGGKQITDIIAETYDISSHEAANYKHENCFLLTSDQYDQVNEKQRDFAQLIELSLSPFIQDIKRWSLGFRVKYGHSLTNIVLAGGTSRISNIKNFVQEKTNIPTDLFNNIPTINDSNNEFKNKCLNFHLCQLMGSAQLSKVKPQNFLFGQFSRGHGQSIPTYSAAFILLRTSIFALFLSVYLAADIFLTNKNIKTENNKVKKMLTKSSLKFTKKEKRYFPRKSKKLLSILKKKNRTIRQEVKTIQSASTINSIAPLAKINQLIGPNKDVTIVYYKGDGELSHVRLKANNEKSLTNIEKLVSNLDLPNSKISKNKNDLTLNYFFEYQDEN